MPPEPAHTRLPADARLGDLLRLPSSSLVPLPKRGHLIVVAHLCLPHRLDVGIHDLKPEMIKLLENTFRATSFYFLQE